MSTSDVFNQLQNLGPFLIYSQISCDDLLEDANAEIIREKWQQQNLHTGAWVFRKCSSACLLGTMSPQILHFSRLREQWAKCRSIFEEGIALSLHAQIGHSQLVSQVKEIGKKRNTSAWKNAPSAIYIFYTQWVEEIKVSILHRIPFNFKVRPS